MSITFSCGKLRSEERRECNFSNVNALDLQRMLWLQATYDGEIKVEQLQEIQRRIIRCLNLKEIRADFHREYREERKPGRATVICGGVTDESWIRRLTELSAVIKFGIENKLSLQWA